MSAFFALIQRDLTLALRDAGAVSLAPIFFLCFVTLIPFAVGPDMPTLAKLAAGLLWLGALFSCLLTFERLFAQDVLDGSLDFLMLGALSLEWVVLAKALAHWLTAALPLVLLSPVLALMLGLELVQGLWIAVTLLAGTPALTFIGVLGAAVCVSLRRGGLLLPVLVLPLAIPVLIFGIAAAQGKASLLVLAGFSLFLMVVSCFAAAVALRSAHD